MQVFKIEGRARGPEYVRAVVSAYDEALSAVADGSFCASSVEQWNRRLSEVFNRGFWQGWYLGAETMELAGGYGSQAKLQKRFAGKCVNYFARAGAAQFLIQAEGFAEGARLLVAGPTTGAVEFQAQGMRCEDAAVQTCSKSQMVTMRVAQRVRAGDKLYVLEPRAVENGLEA